MAAQGVPMRTLQEMMWPPRLQDDADLRDYAPARGEWIEAAFAPKGSRIRTRRP